MTYGIHIRHYDLVEVGQYINWLYFFSAWHFPARMGNIAQIHNCTSCRAEWLGSFNEKEIPKAREAIHLFDDAREMLNGVNGQFQAHAIVGVFPAYSEGDNIVIRESNKKTKIPFLRQQRDSTCLCWSDYIKPYMRHGEDSIGFFATSVDQGLEEAFPNDEYRHLLCQTLADRIAEAAAERMHEEVRKQLWGYAPNEHFTLEELFQERYIGRRPAVGYPSLPDQSINFLLDDILGFEHIGIHLTDSGAMKPHASTSGMLFAHPLARHFAIGQIGEDQLKDYAQRRGYSVEKMRTFLASNL